MECLRLNGELATGWNPYTLSKYGGIGKEREALRAPHIAEAIISSVSAPACRPGSEMRARKLHKVLVESSRAGLGTASPPKKPTTCTCTP